MIYLLDTDTCIGVLRQNQSILRRLTQIPPADCAVSVITLYELLCGVGKAQNPHQERVKVERFFSIVSQLRYDNAAAEAAAHIRVALERQGNLIGPYDLLIAGHALAYGLKLVTNNVREFQRVPNLQWENWY
jgi:tRNA(fMet)-specific endonuclease VapC